MRAQRFELAAQAYTHVTYLRPDFAEGFGRLGFVYGKMKRYREAISALKRAVELKPDYSSAYFNLGLIYLQLNNKRSAAEQLQLLRTIDSGMARELLDDMHPDKIIKAHPLGP